MQTGCGSFDAIKFQFERIGRPKMDRSAACGGNGESFGDRRSAVRRRFRAGRWIAEFKDVAVLVKRYSIVSCVAVAAVGLLALSAVADARVRHHHARSIAHPRSEPVSSNSSDSSPRFAAFVVDAKTGHVLYSKNADAPRHPASLTKMMTLYVLFEELERGRFRWLLRARRRPVPGPR